MRLFINEDGSKDNEDNKDNQDNGDFEDNEDMKMIGTLMIERHQCDDAHDEEDDDNDDDNNDDNDDENMMNLRAGQSGTRSLKSFIATHGQSPVLIVAILVLGHDGDEDDEDDGYCLVC